MENYDHKKIEKKWSAVWKKAGIYKSADFVEGKDNFYLLTEFPYPSGNLHVGHWYAFALPDILARYMRMKGRNVLFPMGFDAFGLPAENAAIKNKLNPRTWTEKNIEYMHEQMASMGASFDWSREVQTIDPSYYKWTQWQFLQFFKKGLVYQKNTAVNWCPKDMTVLANEQVVEGKCERCDSVVEQKLMLQWNIRITEYADRLVDDLDPLDWPEEIKQSQRNWIGRSEGAEIDFPIKFEEREDKKPHFVLLHGKGGSSKNDFFPWLQTELKGRGYTVETPDMPNASEPNDEEQADYVQKHCTINENTVIVGHSFGGIVAMRIVERGMKPAMITLVGTPYSATFKDGKERPTVKAAIEKGFDFQKIKENTAVTLLYDTDDRVVSLSDGEELKKMTDGQLFTTKAEVPHFNGSQEPWVLAACDPTITVFTTRPDTLFGATYLVLSPEHQWVTLALKHKTVLKNNDDVQAYIEQAKRKTELERMTDQKEKTGVKLEGVHAINPATGEKIPMYVADYVLATYGTGAIMAVPAHDKRDHYFAQKFNIPVVHVVAGGTEGNVHEDEGVLMHSGSYDGLSSAEARIKMTEAFGRKKTKYKLRDWIVSRQRYWGVPIPIIHCEKCGAQPVPDESLPVVLPDVDDYLPEGSGKSPLAKVESFVNVKCPKCGDDARRETDTLDTFVDSSWYFLRYTDPKNDGEFAARERQDHWMPVDLYSGGAEHTTMHLLYSRFWHKALYDLGLVADPEPYKRRMNRSLIMGPDGQKMSKSRGNVIDPDEVVERLGADTVRMYLAFIGPYNEVSNYPWNPDGVVGVRRFLEKAFRLQEVVQKDDIPELNAPLHRTIKKVGDDIEVLKFNTAISTLMIFLNESEKQNDKKGGIGERQWELFLKLLEPFAPFVAEELWSRTGHKKPLLEEDWPQYDEGQMRDAKMTIAVQVNGKTRAQVQVSADADKVVQEEAAKEAVSKRILGQKIEKTIQVPGRLVNFVLENNEV